MAEYPFSFRLGRVHEACGPLAVCLAAAMFALTLGYAFWLRERHLPENITPHRLNTFFDVTNLVVAQTGRQTETLAVAEETLRDGVCPIVVMELTAPLTLTEGRRLQLAARTGGTTGLCLTPAHMPNNTAETRWHCSALPDPQSTPEDSTLQRWKLIKNKSGTCGVWDVRWDQSARRLIVVSASCE